MPPQNRQESDGLAKGGLLHWGGSSPLPPVTAVTTLGGGGPPGCLRTGSEVAFEVIMGASRQEVSPMDSSPQPSQSAIPTQPTSPRAPRKPVLDLTPKAIEMVKKAMVDQKLEGFTLRVGIVGGGCSGFNYDLDIIKETRPTDFLFALDGLPIAVDPMSAQYLKGMSIDYVEGLQGAGFKFNNPNAKHTCGCGSSFSA